jgi:serine/threonine protein kinase
MQLLRRHWRGPGLDAEDKSNGGCPPVALGHFQIRRELGRGGYGIVFLAQDLRLGREVALKIPRADFVISDELRARFRQEARTAAGLDHPNIVPIYEAGEAGPVSYIASAYCPSITLAEWLRRQTAPVPFDVAATIVAALADGIQHAHSRGVLHRDLKPANVLMVSGAGVRDECSASRGVATLGLSSHQVPSPTPKITDFGLAKVIQDGAAGIAAGYLTQSGAIVGTPAYMAPEQARGHSREITTATDVYALGVILYEILTRKPPFQGSTPLETLRQIELVEPTPPSRLRAKLPQDLETICLKCLQKAPSRRYASAAALAEDLHRFLEDRPIEARRPGRVQRGWRWCRRNPVVAGLLAGLFAVLLAGTGISTWQAVRAIHERDRAEQNFKLARDVVDRYFTRVGRNCCCKPKNSMTASSMSNRKKRCCTRSWATRTNAWVISAPV